MKVLTFAAAVASATAEFSNSVPIYGTYPGWLTGEGEAKIEVEIFYDMLCSASASQNRVMNNLLVHEWLGSTVQDQITLAITPFVLPYHNHSFQVTQIIPYLMDLCTADSTQCLMNDYKDYCFDNYSFVLSENNMSQDDFITQWSGMVAQEFGLDEDTILGLYDRSTDVYDTNGITREFLKYGFSSQVSGTPTAFVNGVKLDSTPMTVRGWLNVLNSVYDSQYKPAAMEPIE